MTLQIERGFQLEGKVMRHLLGGNHHFDRSANGAQHFAIHLFQGKRSLGRFGELDVRDAYTNNEVGGKFVDMYTKTTRGKLHVHVFFRLNP